MKTDKTILQEFREKFVDHWEGLGQAVVYPIKEGVSSIIPAEDLEKWLLSKVREAREEILEELEKWLFDNGITHKKSFIALRAKLSTLKK